MLVEWLGLKPDEKTWEDIITITRMAPSSNLEDKVKADGIGDVIVGLEFSEVVSRRKEDLVIMEPDQGNNLDKGTTTSTSENCQPPHPTRIRKDKHKANFIYY